MIAEQMDLFALAPVMIPPAVGVGSGPTTAAIATPPGPAVLDADGRVILQDGVEYRTLLLWSRASEALTANSAVCQEFSPAYLGDVLVLEEDGLHGSRRGSYTLMGELVAVKDECQGETKRFIWRFENLRPCQPRPGVCSWKTGRGGELGRIIFVAGGES